MRKANEYARVDVCADPHRWYSDKIGHVFPIVRLGPTETYVRTGDEWDTGNFIQNDEYTLLVTVRRSK